MRKFKISIFLLAAVIGLQMTSCKKDNFNEQDAMNLQNQLDKQKNLNNDSLSAKNYRVAYTITVVDASTSTLKAATVKAAIAGAKIKIVQDTIINSVVDASGIVTFTNLKPGLASVNITLDTYSEVNYTVNLEINNISGTRQLSNIIPLIPITGTSTGTITGKIICETDLTNVTPEIVPAGTKIIATVRSSSAALLSINQGNIVSISYDNLSLTATTDASGNYVLTVPATLNGLDYDIKVADFTADQKIIQNKYLTLDTTGVLTIPTNFGSSFTGSSPIAAADPIIVTISAPNYTSTDAAATAVLDNSKGIDYISLTNSGALYATGTYTLPIDNPSIVQGGITSNGTATFNVNSYGRVTDISSASNRGSNYASAAENTEIVIPYAQTEAIIKVTVSGNAITSYDGYTTAGKYFVNKPSDVYFSYNGGAGSGAQLTPTFTFNNAVGAYEVTSVSLVAGGTGYSNGPQTFAIKSINNALTQAKGLLHMTTGSVSAVNISAGGSNYIDGQVDVVFDSPLSGTTATGSASVVNGKIAAITINNNGSGYTTAPGITIINKAEKTQAKYKAVLTNGQITSYTSVNQGNGYLSVPNVTITPAISGAGAGASAYATVAGGKVISLTVINKGSNYRSNVPVASKDFSGTTFLTVKGSSSTILNIDLGTGKRTIEK